MPYALCTGKTSLFYISWRARVKSAPFALHSANPSARPNGQNVKHETVIETCGVRRSLGNEKEYLSWCHDFLTCIELSLKEQLAIGRETMTR